MPADSTPRRPTPDLSHVLEALVRLVERRSGNFRASILLLSQDGLHLLDAAAPNLPDEYRRLIHGLLIGESAGSCGTAAWRNQPVIVTDIEHDPLWTMYRDIARPFGLAACWSHPIRDSEGSVLGTFAMYYDSPRAPDDAELDLIATAAARAGTIVEQARAGVSSEELVASLG